ncbi:OpgC domain-containing protein [Roseovarius lutimaris]|uniref:OpgC domain-containing protein n=1 Tax=Roseovarius lutimaris TaxID=1005928 RepID=UPI001160CB82|nr:OpgC domain-containing protein [Roseovarius lutimaris]
MFFAGLWQLNFPDHPNPGGRFFSPFSWQFVFVVGLLLVRVVLQDALPDAFDRTITFTNAVRSTNNVCIDVRRCG